MKTACSFVVLCLVLSCSTLAHASRLQRALLQSPSPATVSVVASGGCTTVNGRCFANAAIRTIAINDAATSIASALSIAIGEADGNGDVEASAEAFAVAIARAYALIISNQILEVFVSGQGVACVYVYSNARAYANAIAEATSTAFAESSNEYARAAADCFSSAVASASVEAVQEFSVGGCVTYGYDYFYGRLVTVGYVEAVATAFSSVFTAIRNNDAAAAAACDASGTTTSSSGR